MDKSSNTIDVARRSGIRNRKVFFFFGGAIGIAWLMGWLLIGAWVLGEAVTESGSAQFWNALFAIYAISTGVLYYPVKRFLGSLFFKGFLLSTILLGAFFYFVTVIIGEINIGF